MKVSCKTCHLHFEDDFEQTQAQDCDFWKQLDLDVLSDKDKRALWEWNFGFDFDELFTRTGIQLEAGFRRPAEEPRRWEDIFPGYADLAEAEQREFQIFYGETWGWSKWKYKLWFVYARVRIYLDWRGFFREEAPVWLKAMRRSSSAG